MGAKDKERTQGHHNTNRKTEKLSVTPHDLTTTPKGTQRYKNAEIEKREVTGDRNIRKKKEKGGKGHTPSTKPHEKLPWSYHIPSKIHQLGTCGTKRHTSHKGGEKSGQKWGSKRGRERRHRHPKLTPSIPPTLNYTIMPPQVT